jgi:hypothetical protein
MRCTSPGRITEPSTQAVLVFERTLQDIGNDFHIPVSVSGKALARCHYVFVDYAQDGKAHLTGVIVVSEGKRVGGVEPAVVEVSAILGHAQTDHVLNPPLPNPSAMFALHPNRRDVRCLAKACSICRHFLLKKCSSCLLYAQSNTRKNQCILPGQIRLEK